MFSALALGANLVWSNSVQAKPAKVEAVMCFSTVTSRHPEKYRFTIYGRQILKGDVPKGYELHS